MDFVNVTRTIIGVEEEEQMVMQRMDEVRIQTNCTNATNPQPELENPLSVNGGFIAMAAGLSVVIPLICVLVIQLRRAKNEERERRLAEAAGGEAGSSPGCNDSPPSYEQIFGPDHEPVTPIHSRNGSLDVLIEEQETDGLRNTSSRDNPHTAGGRGDDSQVPLQGPRPNPNRLQSSISTISGSDVVDYPLTSTLEQRANTESASRVENGGNENSTNENSDSTHVTTSSNQNPPSSSPSSSSSPDPAAPSSSSSAPPPPPPPRSSTPPPPPPPSPPPNPWNYSNNRVSSNNSNNTSCNSRNQQTQRRFPGMHISIHDFFASLRGQSDNENEAPPPSYEDALKILESAKKTKR